MAKKLHLVHVKSNVVNKLPSANVINYGEIAVNYNANSPALAIKDSNDNIVKFAPQSYVDSNFVYDAEYYSSGSTHEIRLYDASRNVLATIDADDFIKDGMVHDVYITGDTMVITFNTDAGHEDIELDITDIFDPDIYYTKSEVDEKTVVDSALDTGSTHPVQNKVVYQYILDNELVAAAALNDLNDRKADKDYVDEAVSAASITVDSTIDSASTNPVENRVIYQALEDSKVTVDSTLSTASTNPVQNKVVYQYILDNELAIAASLNDLNDRKADKSYVDAAVTSVTIDVDSVLDSASTNPVENRVIYNALNNVSIDVDDHMDSASTNPVENKVVWKVIRDDEKVMSAAVNDLNDRKADKTYVDDAICGVTIEVDDALDSASTKPVENRVVTNALTGKADKSQVVHDAEYVSTGSTHEIRFYDASGNTLSTIVADDFIKDGMVDDMYISGSTLVVEFNADANKQDILIPLETSPMPIDSDFDSASTHPVENRVIYDKLVDCRPNIFYGTCSTAAATATKAVTCTAFTAADLVKGTMIYVTFSTTNSGAVASLKLNVNGTGELPMKKLYGESVANLSKPGELRANETYLFAYDATNWVCLTLDYNSSTTYSEISEANIKSSTSSAGGLVSGRRFRQALTASTTTELSETSRLPASTSLLTTHANTTIPDTGATSSQMHLPVVTADDNGKTLRVVDGEWALVDETNVYTGSGAPSQSLGNNGDIYLETS